MAEILTESFCERCGTRYTFESPRPRRLGVVRIRTLTRGMRNFVANDSSSFADAMAAARDDESRIASQRQVDAFRETFNFCMGCRQYTCRDCWNERASECLSCAPDLSREVLPAALQQLAPVETTMPDHRNAAEPAWPSADLPGSDLTITPAAELVTPTAVPEQAAASSPAPERAVLAPEELVPQELASQEAEPTAIEVEAAAAAVAPEPELTATAPEPALTAVEPEAAAAAVPPDVELTPEELAAIHGALARQVRAPAAERPVPGPPEAAAPPGGEPAPEAGAASEPALAASAMTIPAEPVANARAATRHLLRRFRPPSDRAMPAATPPTSPSTADLLSAEQADARPSGEAAAAPPAPEDAAVPRPAAAADELPRPGPAPAPIDRTPATLPADHVAQPIWRIVAPESDSPAEQPAAPGRWIAPPAGGRRSADAAPSAPWAARVATARSLESPVWAASSNDILAAGSSGVARPVSIQACVTCGLSLSANARFCRRCGSRQG